MDESKTGKTRRVKLDYPFDGRPEVGEAIEVAPGVQWISMPLHFSLKWINLWLIDDDDGVAIVDCGMNNDDSKEVWEQVFEKVLKGRTVTKVICTHLHPDHVGLAGWLCERFGCELWMSRLEYLTCRMLVGDTGRPTPDAVIDFFGRAGWDEDALQKLRERFGSFGKVVYELPTGFRRLTEGDQLSIGSSSWRVIIGCGHSPEHACLFNEDLNVVISGDQLLPRISSNVSVHPTETEADPLNDWIESCEKLIRELPKDVLVLPSHNEPFRGAHDRLRALIDGHHLALDLLEERLEEPRKVVDCFVTLFGRKVGTGDMYSATGEALAHLNYLRFRGRAAKINENGIDLYTRVS